MKLTKSELDKIKLASATDAALELFKKSKGERIVLETPDGVHIEVGEKKEQEPRKDDKSPSVAIDKLAFNESYKYLENAKGRFNTKSAVGYSDCKANCRNALMSALKTLTGKEEVKEAAKELGNQRILGKREEEFTEYFGKLLGTLYGLDSKKGSHPPMMRNEDDADLALSITTSIVNYVINQATRPRD